MKGRVDVARTRLVEGGGHCWSVFEADYPVASDRGGRCLIFNCDAVIRVVRTYPADWFTRTESALYEVSLSI